MSNLQPATDAQPVTTSEVPDSPPRSLLERLLITIVVAGVIGLVVVAIGQSIGLDAMTMARRWTRVRKLTPQDEPSIVLTGTSLQHFPSRSKPLAGDAQIAPPRRRPTIDSEEKVSQVKAEASEAVQPQIAAVNLAQGTELPISLPADLAGLVPEMKLPGSEPVDSTEELLDTAAQLVSLSWQDFDYPVRWGVAETSKPRMIYAGHRNRLLKAIAHTRPSDLSLELARKDYAIACEQFRDDPRLDYAFGLTLWKHGQHSEAIDMFQTAARLEGEPFLPAALAVAWGRFLIHEERRGLDQLAHISRLLAADPDQFPNASQREQAAMSMGRALGYLSGPGKIDELDETVQLTAIIIRKRLPENLREACQRGYEQVDRRQSELMRLSEISEDQIHSDHQSRQSDLQMRINALQDEMRNASNELMRGHRTHIGTVSQILKEALNVGTQMKNLQSCIRQLHIGRSQLTKPKPNMIARMLPEHFYLSDGGSTLIRQNGTASFMFDERPADRANRISQLTRLRENLTKIEADLSDLRTKQRDLIQRRHDADQQRKLEKDADKSNYFLASATITASNLNNSSFDTLVCFAAIDDFE